MILGGNETDAFELKRMMRQEAHEKAFEIQVQTQRLYEKERDKIIKQGMEQLEENYSKQVLKLTQSLNIERSTAVNKSRLLKMTERNKCMEKVREETKEHILNVILNPENM